MDVEEQMDNAFDRISGLKTCSYCSYDTFLGDTIIERFEGLFVKFVELDNILKVNGAKETVIEVGEFISEWIQCTCANVYDESDKDGENYIGTLSKRWKVYLNDDLMGNEAL